MIKIELSPSLPCRLLSFLSLLFLAASVLLYLSLSWLLPLLLLLFSVSVYKLVKSHGAVLRLTRNDEGDRSMLEDDQEWRSVSLQTNSLLWSQLMVLYFSTDEGRLTPVLLDRCSLSGPQWRQLQVSLKLKQFPDEKA